jgi:hypothetical protein
MLSGASYARASSADELMPVPAAAGVVRERANHARNDNLHHPDRFQREPSEEDEKSEESEEDPAGCE